MCYTTAWCARLAVEDFDIKVAKERGQVGQLHPAPQAQVIFVVSVSKDEEVRARSDEHANDDHLMGLLIELQADGRN